MRPLALRLLTGGWLGKTTIWGLVQAARSLKVNRCRLRLRYSIATVMDAPRAADLQLLQVNKILHFCLPAHRLLPFLVPMQSFRLLLPEGIRIF
jgi:hypothetical protein